MLRLAAAQIDRVAGITAVRRLACPMIDSVFWSSVSVFTHGSGGVLICAGVLPVVAFDGLAMVS